MIRHWSLLLWLAFASTGFTQTFTRQNLADILGFENGSPAAFPAGWSRSPADTIFLDDQHVHSGKFSARIERNASSSGQFSYLLATIPLDFAGSTIEWRGFLKTESVDGFVALWLREDDDTSSLAFATLQNLNLNGTRDWAEYSVSVPVLPQGKRLVFGFLLSGTGKGWVDDLRLLVDGKPVAQSDDLPTAFETDHEFDGGSRINVGDLSNVQIKNLAGLAKVWGFLKYHHPAVTGGLHHWDYELFHILPRVLEAADSVAANSAISSWIAGLGDVEECTNCASLNLDDLYLAPDLDWISDKSLLGADLSRTLQNIYRNRKSASAQFYVSLAPVVFNPVFENELTYGSLRLPDAGYQLLGLFRFWNMVQYFYPNRDIMADDPANSPNYWNEVLEESIPGIALAPDSLSYQQELMKFIAKIHDTHANLRPARRSAPVSCRLRAVQAAGPAAESGSIGRPIGVLQRGRSLFPPTVLYKTPPERLSASHKAVMRIGEREQRKEGEGPPAKLANPPSDPNPVVVFIVRLLTRTTLTDNGIAFTERASTQQDVLAVARPVAFDLVRLGRK